jgi:hypothetical protein
MVVSSSQGTRRKKRMHQSESQYKQGKEKSMEKENILLRRKGTITKRFLWSTKGFELSTSADLKLHNPTLQFPDI